MLLRRRYSITEGLNCREQVGEGNRRVHWRRFAFLSFSRGHEEGLRRDREGHLLHGLLYREVPDRLGGRRRDPARRSFALDRDVPIATSPRIIKRDLPNRRWEVSFA